jgi:hypothetical protein
MLKGNQTTDVSFPSERTTRCGKFFFFFFFFYGINKQVMNTNIIMMIKMFTIHTSINDFKINTFQQEHIYIYITIYIKEKIGFSYLFKEMIYKI